MSHEFYQVSRRTIKFFIHNLRSGRQKLSHNDQTINLIWVSVQDLCQYSSKNHKTTMRTCVYDRYAYYCLRARSPTNRAFQLQMLPIDLGWTSQRTKFQKSKRKRRAWQFSRARQIKNSIKPVLRSGKPQVKLYLWSIK